MRNASVGLRIGGHPHSATHRAAATDSRRTAGVGWNRNHAPNPSVAKLGALLHAKGGAGHRALRGGGGITVERRGLGPKPGGRGSHCPARAVAALRRANHRRTTRPANPNGGATAGPERVAAVPAVAATVAAHRGHRTRTMDMLHNDSGARACPAAGAIPPRAAGPIPAARHVRVTVHGRAPVSGQPVPRGHPPPPVTADPDIGRGRRRRAGLYEWRGRRVRAALGCLLEGHLRLVGLGQVPGCRHGLDRLLIGGQRDRGRRRGVCSSTGRGRGENLPRGGRGRRRRKNLAKSGSRRGLGRRRGRCHSSSRRHAGHLRLMAVPKPTVATAAPIAGVGVDGTSSTATRRVGAAWKLHGANFRTSEVVASDRQNGLGRRCASSSKKGAARGEQHPNENRSTQLQHAPSLTRARGVLTPQCSKGPAP
jgi:hypothetical protein